MNGLVVCAGGMQKLVNQDTGRILGSVDKHAGFVTRIGVAAIDVERTNRGVQVGRERAQGGMCTEENRIEAACTGCKPS
jgi:hypothetical protein